MGKASPPLIQLSGANIAFSHKGLIQVIILVLVRFLTFSKRRIFTQLGIKDVIGDDSFEKGMLAQAEALGDKGTKPASGTFDPDWLPAFKKEIHGLILVTGDCHQTVNTTMSEIKKIFSVGTPNAVIHEVLHLVGDVRPGKEKGHEQFVPFDRPNSLSG